MGIGLCGRSYYRPTVNLKGKAKAGYNQDILLRSSVGEWSGKRRDEVRRKGTDDSFKEKVNVIHFGDCNSFLELESESVSTECL